VIDFAKLNRRLRAEQRISTDPAVRRRARVLDLMDAKQKEVEEMDDTLFFQKLLYYRENSCAPEFQHNYPIKRGESVTYDTVYHLIMLPELLKRHERLLGSKVLAHHFLCEPGYCNHRCRWQEN